MSEFKKCQFGYLQGSEIMILVHFSNQKNAKIHKKEYQNSEPQNVLKNGSFGTSKIPEIDFTDKLSDRKIMIFSDCVIQGCHLYFSTYNRV